MFVAMPLASIGLITFTDPAVAPSPTSKKLITSDLLAAAGGTRTRLNSVVAESELAKMRIFS